jgi:hypothetical protein
MDLISKFYNSESEEEIKDLHIYSKENKENYKESNDINIKEINANDNKIIIPENTNTKAEEIFNEIENKISLLQSAPLVNVDDLLNEQAIKKYEKFNSGNFIPLKPNHLTGYINYHKLNEFNFNEQYYNFNTLGFAQDPTDFCGNKVIGDIKKFEDPNAPKSVYDSINKAQKESRKKLKMKRMKYGDAGSGDFMGPWAIYEGEEIFKNLSGDLTEEQKELLKQIEEKRQKKIEEEKTQETKILSVR